MPKNPNRPKIKYKHVKKPPAPLLTKDELQARNRARLETKLKIDPAKVSAMIAKEHGLLTQICRSLKVSRATLMRYIEKDDGLVEALTHAREAMGDTAERKLFDAIEAGDVRCILYYLSTVHRHRGYGMNNADAASNNDIGRGPVFVETVNIVGIPSGTFLPKEVAAKDSMIIDNDNRA